jgi:hypothetical protein
MGFSVSIFCFNLFCLWRFPPANRMSKIPSSQERHTCTATRMHDLGSFGGKLEALQTPLIAADQFLELRTTLVIENLSGLSGLGRGDAHSKNYDFAWHPAILNVWRDMEATLN